MVKCGQVWSNVVIWLKIADHLIHGCPLVYLPSCIGDICWTSAVLTALGTTLSVILDIDVKLSIILSAIVAVTYTFIGGMYSVAYTDVIQIAFIFVGLWISIPFMWTFDGVELSNLSVKDWTGSIEVSFDGFGHF